MGNSDKSTTAAGESASPSPKRLSRAARLEVEGKAAALRLAGASGQEIANALSLATARAGLRAAERGILQALDATAEDERAMDAMRANIAIEAIWPKVEGGDVAAAAALANLLAVRTQLLGLGGSLPSGRGGGAKGKRGSASSGATDSAPS